MEDEDLEKTNNEDCGQRARCLATLRKRRQREDKIESRPVYTMLRRALILHQLARGLHCVYVSLVYNSDWLCVLETALPYLTLSCLVLCAPVNLGSSVASAQVNCRRFESQDSLFFSKKLLLQVNCSTELN